jgi:hypothetical protein
VVVAGFVANAASLAFVLPLIPVTSLSGSPILEANYDAGETIAWPTYVGQVADAYRQLSADDRATAVIVTSNYGEAGAVDQLGKKHGLPRAFSGGTGYWYWGPPPESATTVVAVGFDQSFLETMFAEVRLATRLDNHLDIDNDEQHAPVWVCSGRVEEWSALWPRFRDF